ncbi:transposase [Candidatus Woesearchaeota archaeon]|nr:transposase [Candidatus Woesearchaeota archaeon]
MGVSYANHLKYLGYKQHFGKGFDNFWTRGYYCGSAGHVSQEQVKRYTKGTKYSYLSLVPLYIQKQEQGSNISCF